MIVRFLAVLELCKQGRVDLEQASSFAELRVCWLGPDGVDAEPGFDVEEYQG